MLVSIWGWCSKHAKNRYRPKKSFPKRIHRAAARSCAMGLNSRALLLCVFLLGIVRFIIRDLLEQELYRDYTRQIRVAHNATAENMLINSGCQISRSILMMLRLL